MTAGMTGFNLTGVRIAISIPDSMHEQAERHAARREISGSELVRRALLSYLNREEMIVEQLDAVYAAEGVR